MSERPVWLLDIDGVINALNPQALPSAYAWPDQWIDTKAVDGIGRTWPIKVARPVLDFIRDVHEQGRAEIRWHTTWQDSAHDLARAIGLPDFPIQEAPEFWQVEEYLRRDQWWKLPAVWRVIASGRRVVWTDDDAETDLRPAQLAALTATDCRIVSPDPMAGLCASDLQRIDHYLGGGS